jgi:hypothetical protein
MFNAQNSHCVEPLHLLLTDITNKYSGSSTELLHLATLIKIKVMLKVVHGKDRSGFHGTTIQPAFRKPSEKNEPSELVGDEISLPPTKVGEKIEYMIGVTSLN